MLLRFQRIDVTKEKRWQIRSGFPQYDPEWIPKTIFYLGIDSDDYLYLYDKKSSVKCGKTKCQFKTWRVDTIERHRAQCSDSTEVKTKQVRTTRRSLCSAG